MLRAASDLAESFDRKRPAGEGMIIQVTLRIVNLWAGLAPLQHNSNMSHSQTVVKQAFVRQASQGHPNWWGKAVSHMLQPARHNKQGPVTVKHGLGWKF